MYATCVQCCLSRWPSRCVSVLEFHTLQSDMLRYCYLYVLPVQLFYMGLVIFTPATAMEVMTDFPLWGSVVITGTVATVYTTVVSIQYHACLE